jgi:hypothetical protein
MTSSKVDYDIARRDADGFKNSYETAEKNANEAKRAYEESNLDEESKKVLED